MRFYKAEGVGCRKHRNKISNLLDAETKLKTYLKYDNCFVNTSYQSKSKCKDDAIGRKIQF